MSRILAVGFAGYHYQMKMHIFDRKQAKDADPTFSVQLYGAHGDSEGISVDL